VNLIRLSLQWKVVNILDSAPPIYESSKLFNIRPNTGLYSQFNFPLEESYIPTFLAPTIVYHQLVGNHLHKKLGLQLQKPRFPYHLYVPYCGNNLLVSLKMRLFPPNVLSHTVRLSTFSTEFNPEHLIVIQRLSELQPIAEIVRCSIGLAASLNHRHFAPSPSFSSKPAIYIEHDTSPDLTTNRKAYIGILIRNKGYASASDSLLDAIIKKNRSHNVKTSEALLLIDKQGILFAGPQSSGRTLSDFRKTHDLFEIALSIAAFLRNYNRIHLQFQDFAEFLLARIKTWIENPQILFENSVSSSVIWELISNELHLKEQLEHILDSSISSALNEKREYFKKYSSVWWSTSGFPSLITEELLRAKGVNFTFLNDAELSEVIVKDYCEAKRSLQGRNFKACILLCGSIVEAMLTSVLINASLPGLSRDKLLRDYNLGKLIDCAAEKNLIHDRTLLKLLDPLRDYRNLIHPGVQLRRSLRPDESKANISLHIVELMIKEFQ
jgi:hypothetical protein